MDIAGGWCNLKGQANRHYITANGLSLCGDIRVIDESWIDDSERLTRRCHHCKNELIRSADRKINGRLSVMGCEC